MAARLVPNWRAILRKAWSVWLMALAVVLTAAEVLLSMVGPGVLPVSQGVFAALSGVTTVGALIARVLVQEDLKDGAS